MRTSIPKAFQTEVRRTRRGPAEHTNQYVSRESPVQQSLRLKGDGYIATNTLFSVAPMIDYTDRHCRFFLRLLSKHVLLYTEMIVDKAILKGNTQKLLQFNVAEHPVAIQLGGSVPAELTAAASIAEAFGYDEINLNVGCPSDRVQHARFGACLMKEPELVAGCFQAMQSRVAIPVTIKTRLGVDQFDSYDFLYGFVNTLQQAGCKKIILHARKAWLSGLSPKENREIPPLRYDMAAAIKRDFPSLAIILNGGIQTLQQIHEQLPNFDGIMIGREAYHNPYFLAEIENTFFGQPLPCRKQILQEYSVYVAEELKQGTPLHHLVKPIFGLFHGINGGRAFRRYLSEHANQNDADSSVLSKALELIAPQQNG